MAQAGIDTAVIAFANAMRVKSIIGITSLIVEARCSGSRRCGRSGSRNMVRGQRIFGGLAVEDYEARLRERLLLPLEKH